MVSHTDPWEGNALRIRINDARLDPDVILARVEIIDAVVRLLAPMSEEETIRHLQAAHGLTAVLTAHVEERSRGFKITPNSLFGPENWGRIALREDIPAMRLEVQQRLVNERRIKA